MDKKIHILFLTTWLRYGGAERVIVNLSRFFAEKDNYCVFIMLLEDGIDYEVSNKVEIVKLHSGRRNVFSKLFSIILDPFRLKRFVREHNVDIVLSFMQRPNAVNMLSRALGSKHLSYVNVRTQMKIHYKNEFGAFAWIAVRLIFRWLWRYADRTIVNSRVIKDEVTSLFNLNPGEVKVIYNPINLEEIRALAKEPIAEGWFKKKDAPIIINVGNFTKAKGHIYLLRAFSLVAAKRPARLVLIGGISNKKDRRNKDAIIKETKRLNIDDKVLFLGWQKNPYKYMARSDLFVLSSIYEGFPNTVLEAMACGCPVAAFDCPSGPSEILLPREDEREDIVRAEYGILVRKMDEASLSKAIEDILNDGKRMEDYAKNGPERASQFDLSGIAKAYERAFKEDEVKIRLEYCPYMV